MEITVVSETDMVPSFPELTLESGGRHASKTETNKCKIKMVVMTMKKKTWYQNPINGLAGPHLGV